MKLTELNPRWLGEHMFAFQCPHCLKAWLTCKSAPMEGGAQRTLIEQAFGNDDYLVAGSREETAWQISGRDFETMTVHPSIDASPSGCWHGFIKNGEIV